MGRRTTSSTSLPAQTRVFVASLAIIGSVLAVGWTELVVAPQPALAVKPTDKPGKPTPTPVPTPTPRPTPMPTPRPTPRPTPKPAVTPKPASVTPKPSVTPEPRPTVAPATDPTRTDAPTSKPTPFRTVAPTPTSPSPTPTPTRSPAAGPIGSGGLHGGGRADEAPPTFLIGVLVSLIGAFALRRAADRDHWRADLDRASQLR
jgi:outer membrane biosynthesis protein TonB